MNKLPKEAFGAVYQLVREKAKYDAAIKDWKRPGGLAGLFARRPADPWPQGMDNARILCQTAFRGAWPELNAFHSGSAGLDDKQAKAEIFVGYDAKLTAQYHCVYSSLESSPRSHTEHYEYKRGYGFRHEYQHSENKEEDARNRNYAYSRAMESRFQQDPFFDSMNRLVDRMREDMRIVERPFSAEEVRSYVRMVQEFSKAESQELEPVRQMRLQGTSPVVDADSYMKSYYENETLRRMVQQGTKEEGSILLRTKFDLNRQEQNNYSGKLGSDLASRVSPAVERENLMAFSKLVYEHRTGKNPDEAENKVESLSVYAELARRNGMDLETIRKDVEKEASGYGIKLSNTAELNVFNSVSRIDLMRRNSLERAIRNGVDEGKPFPEIRKDLMKSFDDDLKTEVQRHKDIIVAKRILSAMDTERAKTGLGVAGALFEKNSSVSLESMSEAMSIAFGHGLNKGSVMKYRDALEEGMDQVYAEALRRKASVDGGLEKSLADLFEVRVKGEGEYESARMSSSSPSLLLAREIAAAACDIEKNSPEKLGAFLRENGVKPVGGDGIAPASDFMKAARMMYSDGNADSAARVMRFREKYKDNISAGKTVLKAQRVDLKPQLKPKAVKGPSIG